MAIRTKTRTKPNGFAATHHALHHWYAQHGRRDLPWRNCQDPYPIYLSEIMLQQTQVKTVLERFYFQFLTRFPTLKSVAAADTQDVLKAWEGLGYYTRARNLHRAAIACGGVLPDMVDALLALPGIGKNTAHAVAAFAFHVPVPVMEANLKRVLARVFALENPSDNALWDAAWALLDRENPFDYNQAMMDVGALLCTPKAPKCGECPLRATCLGQKTPEQYGVKKPAKTIPTRKVRIYMVADAAGRYFLRPRSTALLSGLYEFPTLAAKEKTLTLEGQKIPLKTAKKIGLVEHAYSHFHLQAEVFTLQLPTPARGNSWFTRDEISTLPLSRTEHKALKLLDERD